MNRLMVRNGIVVLGLCATAALLPAHRSEAQAYTCEDCMNGALAVLTLCFQYTPGEDCVGQYNQNVQLCYTHGFCPG
jgi:hypothetical protein